MKRLLSLLTLFLLTVPALAADKPLVMESGQIKQLPSATSLQLQAPTTANATVNLPHGTAPTSPTNGDCWTTTAGFYCRINGTTVGPYAASGVTSVATSGLVTGGTITSTGTISLSSIGAGHVVANSTGSTAAPADTTLTAIIDQAIGSTQGQILYRGASAWSVLSPGTSGQLLQTGGASANPSWTTVSGGGTVTVSGTPTTGNCAKFSGATQITDAGAACGSGGGGGLTLIASATTTAGQSSVTFSSIPGTYTHLEIVGDHASTLNNSGTTNVLGIQFNSDTGNNYRFTIFGSYSSGTGFGNGSSSANSLGISLNASNGTSGVPFGGSRISIPNYLSTREKNAVGQASAVQGNVGILQATASGWWTGTSAITSITIVDRGGNNFATGSKFWLYGY